MWQYLCRLLYNCIAKKILNFAHLKKNTLILSSPNVRQWPTVASRTGEDFHAFGVREGGAQSRRLHRKRSLPVGYSRAP